MADLTTVANVKSWIGLAAGTDDILLARLVSGVSTWVQEWIGRTIATGSYTERLNGNGKNVLFFLNYPVTAITSVTIDGVLIPARTVIGGAGYSFDADCLYLDGYSFSVGRQNVVIVYTAGFAATPADLEQAAIQLIALRYRDKDRIGVTSRSIGPEHTTFFQKDFPEDVQSVLWSYKRVVPI